VSQSERTQMDGLRFFGMFSASISHEIKNVLAIISESAGLMEDLLLLAKRGGHLDPERFKALCEKIRRQTQRADGIIKNMNRFSHTVDQDLQRIDLCEMVLLVKGLSDRLASMRGVSLEAAGGGDAVWVTTNPFFLARQVWACLDLAMSAASPEKRVQLFVADEPKHGSVVFGGLFQEALSERLNFLAEKERSAMTFLGATLLAGEHEGEFRFRLPKEPVPP